MLFYISNFILGYWCQAPSYQVVRERLHRQGNNSRPKGSVPFRAPMLDADTGGQFFCVVGKTQHKKNRPHCVLCGAVEQALVPGTKLSPSYQVIRERPHR